MDMVTLVQQQQQTLDGNHEVQEEQDHVNGAVVSAQSHAVDCRSRFRGEAGRSARETAVVAPSNGSFGDYSSTQCSDNDDDGEETDVQEGGGWITNLPVSSTIVQQHQAFATTNGDIALQNAEPSIFGNISVANSTEVRVGNETIYNGPVTIHVNQVVYTNPTPNLKDKSKPEDESEPEDESKLDISRASDNISYLSEISASKDNEAPNGSISSQNTKLNKVTQWLWRWKRATLSCVLALILLAIVVSITVYFTHLSDAPDFLEMTNSSLEGIKVTVPSEHFVGMIGAQSPLTKLKLPVPYVIISHTGTEFCTTQFFCTFLVKFVQRFDEYNFFVGGDGLVYYVDRGWDYVGAHSYGFNNKSIGIAFIGTFDSVVPPKTQLDAAQKIIKFGVQAGKIAPDYKLLGHLQVSNITILHPGDALYNEIKKWPHWSPQS